MRSRWILLMTLSFVPTAVMAQVPAGPGMDGARIETIEYGRDQVVPIRVAAGYVVTIELASDEHIRSIALGDSGTWQAMPNKAGNMLFIKPLQAGTSTNMTVLTDVRSYAFDLSGVADARADLPYTIRFHYPKAGAGDAPAGPMIGGYRLRGARSLFPATLGDDGTRTFIDWPPDRPLPAVYGRDIDGRETLVNGNMRGRFFVIDSVLPHLVFRLDDRHARADRLQVREKR